MSRRDEAAHWFAALRRGVMTLEERLAYDAWYARRENRTALAQMEELWGVLDGAPRPAAASPMLRRVMLAAVCAVSLGIGVLSSTGGGTFWTSLDWTDR